MEMSTVRSSGIAQVSEAAPNFRVEAVMETGEFGEVNLENYLGKKYVVLFFYPNDFTFVCPSEIIAFHNAFSEFAMRDVQILGCSFDSKYCHLAWRETPISRGGIGKINFPLLADVNRQIATDYGVYVPRTGRLLRGLFLIDKRGIVQHTLVNADGIGRSTDEVIRIIDALKYTEENGEVCPANWKKGGKGMVPTAAGVAKYMNENAISVESKLK